MLLPAWWRKRWFGLSWGASRSRFRDCRNPLLQRSTRKAVALPQPDFCDIYNVWSGCWMFSWSLDIESVFWIDFERLRKRVSNSAKGLGIISSRPSLFIVFNPSSFFEKSRFIVVCDIDCLEIQSCTLPAAGVWSRNIWLKSLLYSIGVHFSFMSISDTKVALTLRQFSTGEKGVPPEVGKVEAMTVF
jgi:hypothetical protein